LFLCEAAPAVIFGIITFFYLTDRPAQADWLDAQERAWLAAEMEKERRVVETGRSISVLQTLFNPRVLALAAIHFGQAGVSVGIAVFAAQIIKQLGLTNMQTGFTTAIPYALGTIGMIVWGSYSDRKNERRWNLTASCPTMAVGCVIAGLLDNSYWPWWGCRSPRSAYTRRTPICSRCRRCS
jgi:sugar phosphate permease